MTTMKPKTYRKWCRENGRKWYGLSVVEGNEHRRYRTDFHLQVDPENLPPEVMESYESYRTYLNGWREEAFDHVKRMMAEERRMKEEEGKTTKADFPPKETK
jgi:hypothetical protein